MFTSIRKRGDTPLRNVNKDGERQWYFGFKIEFFW